MYKKIKESLLLKSKTVLPDYIVFFENIKKLNDAIKNQYITDYVHIELNSIMIKSISEHMKENVLSVMIMIHDKKEDNLNYQEIANKFKEQVVPVFSFADRNITIAEIEVNIHDDSLYISFSFSYVEGEEPEADEPFVETM